MQFKFLTATSPKINLSTQCNAYALIYANCFISIGYNQLLSHLPYTDWTMTCIGECMIVY